MIFWLQLAGLIMAAVAVCDRRSWPLVMMVLMVWMGTQITEGLSDRLAGLALRVPIDIFSGALAVALTDRKRWFSALFVLMLLNHATYWFAYSIKVNLWWFYPHALNALWLAQMAIVAWPGGRNLVGSGSLALSRIASWRSRSRRRAEPKGRSTGSGKFARLGVGVIQARRDLHISTRP